MNNKGLLVLIAAILIGIFTVMVVQMNQDTPAEEISESVSDTIDDVGDEIQNN